MVFKENRYYQQVGGFLASGNQLNALGEFVLDGIQPNTGKYNLKCSWTQCANLFFPFYYKADIRGILVSFLSQQLALRITDIEALELEYAALEC